MALLSVPEYAEYIGISTQAVYKQIQKNKLPYTEKLENGKKVKYIIVNEEQPIQPIDNQPNQPVEQPIKPIQPVEQPQLQNLQILQQNLQILQNQLEEKDKQIEKLQKQIEENAAFNILKSQLAEKDKQIQNLQVLLSREQELQRQSALLLAEKNKEPEVEPIVEEEQPQGLLAKLKSIFK